jgi:hypothetical protein
MRYIPLLVAGVLMVGLAPWMRGQDENADNTIHAITTLHDDGSKTVTITDPDKHTSEATTYDGGNKMTQRVAYALDDQNQVASGVIYSAKNLPVFKSVYKRDDSNRLSEEDDYTMDDQLIRRFVYEFGADGKVSRIRAFDGQGNELQQTAATKDKRQSLPRTH